MMLSEDNPHTSLHSIFEKIEILLPSKDNPIIPVEVNPQITSPPFLKRYQLCIGFNYNVDSDINGPQLAISSLLGQPIVSLSIFPP